MKFAIAFALLVSTCYAALDAEFKEKMMKKIHEVGAGCAEQENANGEDISELLEKKMPSRKEGQCLVACFHEKFGVQDKDGKASVEGAIKAIEPFKAADAELYGKFKTITEKCVGAAAGAGDRCEIAMKIASCSKKEAEAVGVDETVLM